jgi:DNA-binding PadR family transcriptional regulator
MLEDEGLVRCEAQDGKKTYEITDEGRAYLEEHGDVVDKIFKRVGSFAEGVFGRHSRDLTGAFSRLASVVLETTLTGRTSPEEAEKISRILDRAREEIEGIMRGEEDEDSSEDPNGETTGAATEEAAPE